MNFRLQFFPLFCSLMLVVVMGQVQARNLPEFSDLIEKHSPAVVKINTIEHSQSRSRLEFSHPNIPDIFRDFFEQRRMPERDVQSMGSGFIISSDGYVLTNNHVVEDADEILVRLIDRREFVATVIGSDERSDLALLKIDADKLPTLKFADPDKLKVGEWVLAIGSPFGLDYSASAGIVSAIGRSIPTENNENYVPFIQTDVAINPGNSGGPLFNLDGEVVGVNSQIYTRSGGSIGLSFAIPISVAKEVVTQLKAKGRVDRGWLGVSIQEVDRDLANSFGLEKPTGALIASLEPDGPADKAGLHTGDIIVKLGKIDIETYGDLPHAVGRIAPGTEVEVMVIREGKKKTLDVKVGTLSGSVQANDEVTTDDIAGGRLGLVVEDLDEGLKKSWSIDSGVVVKQVIPDGAGAAAGLMPGDVIAQLAFKEVDNVDQYGTVVTNLPANQLLPIRFFRRGRPAFRTIMIKE